MADVIARLKVESKEYDAKIERARSGLLKLEDSLRKAGKTMADADKDQVAYVRSLGNMETVARTTRGKLSELTKAFTDLKLQYKAMTDAEKQSPIGQALSQSLDTLKNRITETKRDLGDVSAELGETKNSSQGAISALDTLASKFGINVKQLTLMGAAMGATAAAVKVAKDAFFENESAVDEWGRVVASAESVYKGFLNALNTGDISGFLSRIDDIVNAARAAYDELDRLGTMRTIQAPQMSAQQTENERMRAMLATGRYIAPMDGRRAAMQNGQLLTPEQLKSIEAHLQRGMESVVKLVGNEVTQTSKAIEAVYNRQAAELGMSAEEFRRGTSSMAEFDRRIEGAQKYSEWQRANSFVDQASGRVVAPTTGNPYAQFKGWDVFRVDGDRYGELVKLIQQRDQQAGSAYGMQAQAYRTINRAEGITVRNQMNGGGSGSKSTPKPKLVEGGLNIKTTKEAEVGLQGMTETLAELREAQQKYKRAMDNATTQLEFQEAQQGYKRTSQQIALRPQALQLGISTESMAGIEDQLKELMEETKKNLPKIEIEASVNTSNTKKQAAEMGENWKAAASAIQAVGSAMESIEDPAAKVMGTIAQAIATMALSYAQAAASPAVTGTGWGWIAFAATGLATMVSSIAAIKEATAGAYAEGGIIPGNSFSGDKLTASVNSGELILNRAQQGVIAGALTESGSGHSTNSQPYVSGEQIYLGLNNYLRRSNRGELVTSR